MVKGSGELRLVLYIQEQRFVSSEYGRVKDEGKGDTIQGQRSLTQNKLGNIP